VSLAAFFLRRLLWTVPLVLGVMLATFALMRGSGGDPFNPPEGFGFALPASMQKELTEYYNLDRPWFVEYATYVGHVARFDFGPSLVFRGLSVTDVITQSFPVTLELVALAALVALPLGIGLGIAAALRRNRLTDLVATSTASVLLVVPVFFVAYLLSQYPVVRWGIVDGGWSGRSKILPTISLALAPIGYVARLIRAAMVETLQEDYVRTARAKGLRLPRIVVVHVLRNSLTPLVSAVVPMLALLITGAFFVEEFFGIPGASAFFLRAAQARDYPLLLGLTVALTVVVLVANLLADTFLMLVDPRLREFE
jgi:oligopeptide transport system permease protein